MRPLIPFRVVWAVWWHQFGRLDPHWPTYNVIDGHEVAVCVECGRTWRFWPDPAQEEE